jgi:hypothetical protein
MIKSGAGCLRVADAGLGLYDTAVNRTGMPFTVVTHAAFLEGGIDI